MKHAILIMGALLAGFVGGTLGTLAIHSREQQHPEAVIRARSFELVDNAGRVISFWGIDKGEDVVLAFAGRPVAQPPGPGSHPTYIPGDLKDPTKQLAAIGVVDESAFLKFRGADGETRVRLYLSLEGKPVLLMEDETGPRIALGNEWSDTPGPDDNDWTLVFKPERARIGMYTRKDDKGQTYIRGGLTVNEDKYLLSEPR